MMTSMDIFVVFVPYRYRYEFCDLVVARLLCCVDVTILLKKRTDEVVCRSLLNCLRKGRLLDIMTLKSTVINHCAISYIVVMSVLE
jgi:hypothetical protein